MNKTFGILIFTSLFILQRPAFAVDATLHISNREIVEALTAVRGDIKRLEDGQKALDKGLNTRIDDLRSKMNGRFEEVNHRFDALQWIFGLFITIALVILGFVLRMQWQMQRRQTQMETVLETQREDLSFIKKIIEKFIPPRGVL